MTGPLPDPRDPLKKSLISVLVGHTTTTGSSDSIDAEIEAIADAVREFATEYAKAAWNVLVTNEISPARDEAQEPHDPSELHSYWSVVANNLDLLIIHPRDNGSTALGEFEKLALDSPSQPLVMVPVVEGATISRAWLGQPGKYEQVKFVPGPRSRQGRSSRARAGSQALPLG